MTTTAADQVIQELTKDDRCDRCGAQAKVEIELHSGGTLTFCSHHHREHQPRLDLISSILREAPDTPRED